jgi:anthranilate synthase
MVDHQDSFVHSLADYFRQCGAGLQTHRPASARALLLRENFDLVVLSPGPGRPADFDVRGTIDVALAQGVAVFGVCLGLQGLVEYFGGSLGQLARPMHGKSSQLSHDGSRLFRGIANEFSAGRYHSLIAAEVPACFRVSARSEDGTVMAVEHASLPVAAVQFHPESILTCGERAGQTLVQNVLRSLCSRAGNLQPDCEPAGQSLETQDLKAGA